MADAKITQLTELTTPITSDIIVIVYDPGGTPITKKATLANTLTDVLITTSDVTTNNVSTTKHGFTPKAPNSTTQFLRGDATWATTVPISTVKLTADETGKTDATLVNTSLSFSVTSGVYYQFRFTIVARTTVATVGIKLALTVPTFTIFSARVGTMQGSMSANSELQGSITASGGAAVGTAMLATNTDYISTIEGILLPSANGTLMVQYAAETTGATVTMKQGSIGVLITAL